MQIGKTAPATASPKKRPGEEPNKGRPANRLTGQASAAPVENKTVLRSLLDWSKVDMRDVCRGMLDEHGGHLRNRNGGGNTPDRFRRFSSSTPARLAEGLGSKRLSLADGRCAPKTWVPRSRGLPGFGNLRNSPLEYYCQPTRRICVVFVKDNALVEKLNSLCLHRIFGARVWLRVQQRKGAFLGSRMRIGLV